MSVTGVGGSLVSGLEKFDLQEMLKERNAETLEAEALASRTTPVPLAAQSSSNPMSRNFASAEREGSRYVDAALTSFETDRQMKNAAISSMWAALDDMGGATGETRNLRHRQQQFEAAAKGAEEMQQAIEQKAAEAMAPTDADGNPILVPGTGTGGADASGQAGSAAVDAGSVTVDLSVSVSAPSSPSLDVVV